MPLPPPSPPTPRLSSQTRTEIKQAINEVIDQVIDRVAAKGLNSTDPLEAHGRALKPFLAALFPSIIGPSEVERSLSTRMGNLMQTMTVVIARQNGNTATAQHLVTGQVASGVVDYINHLRRSGRARQHDPPHLAKEITTMKSLNTGEKTADKVEIDVFIDSGGQEYYLDLKTPTPNSEQPRDMKYRLMMARALRLPKDVSAYAVFYYNPHGLLGDYSAGRVYLDYTGGEVLVGKAYWDFIGGSGSFEELIALLQEVGKDRWSDLAGLA